MPDHPGERGGWLRAGGLLGCVLGLSVLSPWALVAIPFAVLAVFLPGRTPFLLVAAGVATFVGFGGGAGPRDGIWFLERAWSLILGGWFLALTLRWPRAPFFSRGLGAVAGAAAILAAAFWSRPGDWSVVEWAVTSRMMEGVSTALQAFRALSGRELLAPGFEESVYEAVAMQGRIFPALVGLASLSALGVAWWLWSRLARGRSDGLAPLREFRFNDQLIWVFIGGMGLALLGWSGATERLGANALVFMAALYALRGGAVVLAGTGGISFLGVVLLILALLLLAPVLLAGAVALGVGDTWLDLRTRMRRSPGDG